MKKIFVKGIILKEKLKGRLKEKLDDKKGSFYTDNAMQIIIAIVLGGLLLAGLYSVYKDTLIPTLQQKLRDMLNYTK